MPFAKGSAPQIAHYAEGGAVLGRTTDFIKTPDRFRGRPNPPAIKTDEDWEGGKPRGRDKSLPPIKPRG